jgi:hypothetical protein
VGVAQLDTAARTAGGAWRGPHPPGYGSTAVWRACESRPVGLVDGTEQIPTPEPCRAEMTWTRA